MVADSFKELLLYIKANRVESILSLYGRFESTNLYSPSLFWEIRAVGNDYVIIQAQQSKECTIIPISSILKVDIIGNLLGVE